jgi:hypothetical protein
LLELARENMKSAERSAPQAGHLRLARDRAAALHTQQRTARRRSAQRAVHARSSRGQERGRQLEVYGENFSTMAREMADSTAPKIKSKIDAILTEEGARSSRPAHHRG